MSPIIEARDPALWQDVAPDEIWKRYREAMAQKVHDLFRGDRARPVVELREDPSDKRESGRP